MSAASSVSAKQVRLLPGSPFYDRYRTGYLASFDPERLLFEYRKMASRPQAVDGGYAGWDSEFLRGHMAGHYLSAASRMGDSALCANVELIVDELACCQAALGDSGYLAAFPVTAFDFLEGKGEDRDHVTVPYYILHKLLDGLLDAHHYLEIAQALVVAEKLGNFIHARLSALGADEIETMLRTDLVRNPLNEFGAIGDALARLFCVTGDRRHLDSAELFNRPWFVAPLVAGEDRLWGLHANTHVAQALGIARCANLTGNSDWVKASENFWRLVTEEHSVVVGGNSFREWFDEGGVEAGPSIDGERSLPPSTAESCNTHNMLKLTSLLIEREPKAAYADFFERALYNHILATVAPDGGAVTYFLPLRGNFRTYLRGTYCCVGTGIENPARYPEGIYFEAPRALWINLYIPSEMSSDDGDYMLRQEGELFTFVERSSTEPLTLHFRMPHWLSGPAVVVINGDPLPHTASPSSYLSITRNWRRGDTISLTLPGGLRLERAKDDPSMVSIFHGPVLLAGELGSDGMPDDYGANTDHLDLPPAPVPPIVSQSYNPADWLEPLETDPNAFRSVSALTFRPLYDVHHQRYSVYWKRI